eukprot:jgi/Botrbrau1/19547/Bobra.0035s0039.1
MALPAYLAVPPSPLAFASSHLESQFVEYQKESFRNPATIYCMFQVVATFALLFRLCSEGMCSPRIWLVTGLSFLIWLPTIFLLQKPGAVLSMRAWLLLGMGLFWHTDVVGIPMRGAFPEVLGTDPLSLFSYFRDFIHGGGVHMAIIIPGLCFPLPYWYELFTLMGVSTFWEVHNGWHCRHNLAPVHLPTTTAYLSKTLVEPLTLSMTLSVGGERPNLFLTNGKEATTCEAVTALGQWLAALGICLYHVATEIKLRRTFLAREMHRYPRYRTLFQTWPLGSAKGVNQCIFAFLAPVTAFAVLWQAWLVLIGCVGTAWDSGPPFMPLLRFPFWFQPS